MTPHRIENSRTFFGKNRKEADKSERTGKSDSPKRIGTAKKSFLQNPAYQGRPGIILPEIILPEIIHGRKLRFPRQAGRTVGASV